MGSESLLNSPVKLLNSLIAKTYSVGFLTKGKRRAAPRAGGARRRRDAGGE